MTAGGRDTLITLHRFTSTTDQYGDPVEDWTELGKEWAQVFWGRGDERRSAAMEQGAQPATFRIPSNPRTRELTPRDRILLDGVTWDIQGVAPMNRADVEITAIRGEAPAEAPAPPRGGLNFAVPANSGLLALLLDDLAYVETGDHRGTLNFSDPANSGLISLMEFI